jgi:hypothetical protein
MGIVVSSGARAARLAIVFSGASACRMPLCSTADSTRAVAPRLTLSAALPWTVAALVSVTVTVCGPSPLRVTEKLCEPLSVLANV